MKYAGQALSTSVQRGERWRNQRHGEPRVHAARGAGSRGPQPVNARRPGPAPATGRVPHRAQGAHRGAPPRRADRAMRGRAARGRGGRPTELPARSPGLETQSGRQSESSAAPSEPQPRRPRSRPWSGPPRRPAWPAGWRCGRATSRRKVAGIPVGRSVPLRSVLKEAQHVGKEIGKAGFRLGVGDVSMEVQHGRNDSAKRDSPLEVLINGLTARRPRSLTTTRRRAPHVVPVDARRLDEPSRTRLSCGQDSSATQGGTRPMTRALGRVGMLLVVALVFAAPAAANHVQCGDVSRRIRRWTAI